MLARFVHRLAAFTAILGGIALTFLIIMTCISIIGRELVPLGLAPIPGDFEIVNVGTAFTVFCFLPLCQIHGAHATVDIFTSALNPKANRFLIAFWEIVFAAILILITWRLYEGMQGKIRNGETSMFLQFSIWWAYAACLAPACVGSIVGIWSAWDRLRAALTGYETRPFQKEAGH